MVNNPNELMHHGILGMKWGVRRFQNSDGSLTAAGRKRYNQEMSKLKEEEKKIKNQERTKAKIDKLEAKKAELAERKKALEGKKDSDSEENTKNDIKEIAKSKLTSKNKKVKDMSDDELQAVIDRLNLEKKYTEIVKEMENPNSNTSKGKKILEEILTNSAKNIGGQAVTYVMGIAANKVLEGLDDDPKSVNPKKGQKDK